MTKYNTIHELLLYSGRAHCGDYCIWMLGMDTCLAEEPSAPASVSGRSYYFPGTIARGTLDIADLSVLGRVPGTLSLDAQICLHLLRISQQNMQQGQHTIPPNTS